MERKNGGFSLVEVLVAIAVLALIVGPLLHSFVTAVSTNGKARSKERATAVAQNLMEEEVVALPSDGLTEENGWSTVQDADSGEVTGYEKQLRGIEFDNHSYDARITLDSSAYKTENETELADIYNMDMSQDACYVEPAEDLKVENSSNTAAQQYLEWMMQNNPHTTMTEEEIKKRMVRTITLDIKLNGKLNAPHSVQVKLTCEYQLSHGDLRLEEEKITLIDKEEIFNNVDSAKELRNIYLFYRPQYSSVQGNYTDKMVINNPSEVPVKVFLVRQKNIAVNPLEEEQYRMQLLVFEREEGLLELPADDPGLEWIRDADYQGATSIRSNLGWSLEDGKEFSGNSQIHFQYRRFGSYCTGDMRDEKTKQVAQFASLINLSARDHLFSVSIEVFEEGDENPFREEKWLYTLSGIKEN